MVDFLSEFLIYFFPNITNYPDWVTILLGCIPLCFVFRIVCAIIHACGGRKL